jgi:hypothetical protein
VGLSKCLFLPLTHQISSSILSDPTSSLCAGSLASLRGVVETRLGIGLFDVPVRTPQQCDLEISSSHSRTARCITNTVLEDRQDRSPPRFRLNFKSSTQFRGLAFCVEEQSPSEAGPLFGSRFDPPLEASCLITSISWHIHSQGPETRLGTHESLPFDTIKVRLNSASKPQGSCKSSATLPLL